MSESFFDEQTEQSEVKAALVAKYFPAYMRVIASAQRQYGGDRIAYIDLFAGPGRYKNGANSTPVKIIEQAIADPDMRQRLVAIFNDKHLDQLFVDGKWMTDTANRLGVPLLAGSSLPLAWRDPVVDWPLGVEVSDALVIAYGPIERYGFHALEALQCMVERRRGGETGVRSVRCLSGKAVWESSSAGTWWHPHLDALRAARLAVHPNSKPADAGDDDDLFLIQYSDGLKGAVAMLKSANESIGFSGRIRGREGLESTLFELEYERPFGHFGYLLRAIEHMVQTGRAAYPVERTLLTSGLVTAGLQSLANGQKRFETPHLSVRYTPTGESTFWRD